MVLGDDYHKIKILHFASVELKRPRQNKIYLFKKFTLTSSLGDQFKSGGGEGGLFHKHITLESGVTKTFAELP